MEIVIAVKNGTISTRTGSDSLVSTGRSAFMQAKSGDLEDDWLWSNRSDARSREGNGGRVHRYMTHVSLLYVLLPTVRQHMCHKVVQDLI